MSDQPVRRAEQRASDADRDVVAGDLRNAFDVGRLDADEYQLRLDAVWRSRTYGDLDKLTADLPEPLQRMHAQAAQGRKAIEEVKGRELAQRLGQWKAWLGVAVLMIAIWTIGSITSGELHHFRPLWPMCIWGAVLAVGALGDKDR